MPRAQDFEGKHPAAVAFEKNGPAALGFGFSAGGLLFSYYIGCPLVILLVDEANGLLLLRTWRCKLARI